MKLSTSDYLAKIPLERKQIVDGLIAAILELYPNAEVSMKYKMPTFEVGAGWVAVANQKNYVSLYTCAYSHIKSFKERHPKIKTGKGCINFTQTDKLPIEDIKQVVNHAIEHPKG